jgi:hypothetical protein
MSNVIWYLKQLLPLFYCTEYIENGKRYATTWRMWFGRCYSVRKWRVWEGLSG